MRLAKLIPVIGCSTFLFCTSVHAVDPPQQECNFDGSQREINDCAAERQNWADAEMNVLYKRQMQRLGTISRERLRQAQRAWIIYRDKTCEYEAGPKAELRSFWIAQDLLCRLQLTKQRSELLNEYLECTSEGGCPQ